MKELEILSRVFLLHQVLGPEVAPPERDLEF